MKCGLVVSMFGNVVGQDDWHSPVSLTKSTYQQALTPYHFNEVQHTLLDDPVPLRSQIIQETWETLVIENGLVKVTLLPSKGGRILSMVYKPTDQEMLFQNPLATPYGYQEGNFFLDWMMVIGGIYPTFPSPEHGKVWPLPYDVNVTMNSDEEVAVQMSITDDTDPAKVGYTPPGSFTPYAKSTGLKLTTTVRVKRSSAKFDYELKLENPTDHTIDYEYWTCTTMTPGTPVGQPTVSNLNSEIVSPSTKVYTPDWSNATVAKTETFLPDETCIETGHPGETFPVYEWDLMKKLGGWDDMAILYAYDKNGRGGVTEDWWGALNPDNNVAVMRVSDHKKTPGMKMWTWGKDSVNRDLNKPDPVRPYLELWGGHSHNFFNRVQMTGGDSKEWVETYYSIHGLSAIRT